MKRKYSRSKYNAKKTGETFQEIKEAPEREAYNMEEIFNIVSEIQNAAYFGETDGSEYYMREKLYEIDMLARQILDMQK